MNYEELSSQAQALTYRDKLRLAHLLIQWARKEEEEQNPVLRSAAAKCAPSVSDSVHYVADRLKKTKPGTRQKLLNAIGAMFQFRGAISDWDKAKLVGQLQEMRFLTVTGDDRVVYPNSVPLGSKPRNTPRQAMKATAAASPAS